MRLIAIKRVLFLLSLTFVCIINGSCATQEEKLTIEIVAAGTESAFWTTAYAGALAATEQYHVDIKLFGPELESNYRQQGHIVYQSIARKPDAILLAAADSALEKEVLDTVNGDLTIVAVNSGTNDQRVSASVGTDNRALGQTLAQEIMMRFTGGTIAVVNDIAASATATEREAGFLETIAENAAFSVLTTVYCDADADTAEKQAMIILESNQDLTAIVCLSTQATTGVCRAIEKAETSDVFVGGVDCSSEEAWFMECGILDVTICQNPYAIGYLSVEKAIHHMRGKASENMIYTDLKVITKENMLLKENQKLIFPMP